MVPKDGFLGKIRVLGGLSFAHQQYGEKIRSITLPILHFSLHYSLLEKCKDDAKYRINAISHSVTMTYDIFFPKLIA
jgi:hypothetical protein